ncbi:MAG: S41 family peptidase [Bacteroidota bacterium]
MKKILFLITLLLPIGIHAQNCDCEEVFSWTKRTFEENDAGFSYIIAKKGEQAYAVHNELIQAKVSEIDSPIKCQNIVREWLSFFRQGHVEFNYLGETDETVAGPLEEGEEGTEQPLEDNPLYQKFLTASNPFLETLNDNTLYLRIPSFAGSEKSKIDSLIASNRSKILSTKHLIIDIRNGTGGSDVSFESLLPILYTNPIRTPGVEFLSTKLNNQRMYQLATNTGIVEDYGLDLSAEEMKQYRAYYDTLSNHLGEFVSLSPEEVSVTTFDTVYTYPQSIGILINERNASNDEQFLLSAKQSKKVKLFGTTTQGALDVSNLFFTYSPEEDFVLVYALSKSLRIPNFVIDDIGIKPDFYLDKEIPFSEWIKHTAKVLDE